MTKRQAAKRLLVEVLEAIDYLEALQKEEPRPPIGEAQWPDEE